MISLEKIVSNNLDLLKSQEAELQKSLSFVQKAKQLFLEQWGPTANGSTGKKRGPKKGSKRKSTRTVKASRRAKSIKAGPKSSPKAKGAAKSKRISHLTNIMDVLKKSGKPMTSGDLISNLFKRQKADKNLQHYRLLIYPVLTKAYASKTLQLKDGKIHLPK